MADPMNTEKTPHANTEKKTPHDKRAQMGVATIAEAPDAHRNEKVGKVVSTKMEKTIVVEVEMRRAHPKYKRVIKSNKKFYAHDEVGLAHMGDVVRIRETRPLSKLKRWQLKDIVQRSSLAQVEEALTVATE